MTKNMIFSVIDHFLIKYFATFTTQHTGGGSIIWMITQEPPFVMTLTGSQNTPVLVIETGHRSLSTPMCITKAWIRDNSKSWLKRM